MTRRSFGLSLGAAFAAQAAPSAEEKLHPLFDGRSIDDWIKRSGHAEYRLEGGAIIGRTVEGSPNTFLCPPKDYGDFILEFETKTDPRLNSGVQIRAQAYATETEAILYNRGVRKRSFSAGRVRGYQVEIANAEDGSSGGIFDEARRGWLDDPADDPKASKAFRDNEWNRYRVEARGDRIRTWVNGAPCADVVDSLDLEGFFGFQVHSYRGPEPVEVGWRNIRVRDLGRHIWKPIEGWSPQGGGQWNVSGGVIHGRARGGDEPGWMVSDKTHKDFTVRFEYKIVKGNSGFFFRAPENFREPNIVKGYEVEIDATRDPGKLQEPGGRWAIGEVNEEMLGAYYRPGEWNQITVSAHGGRIATHINGLRTSNLTDDPGAREGRLIFQMWSSKNDVEVLFRNPEILTRQS